MKKTARQLSPKRPMKAQKKLTQKGKAGSGKAAAQKTIPKKTSPRKKTKPATPQTTVPEKPAGRKTALKTKREPHPKEAITATARSNRKKELPMSEEERKAELRRSLIQKREAIVREVKNEISKYIKGETRQLVDTALDDGDWSVVDLSEDISFKHMSTHRENLLKIDEALRKLSEGTYGMCEDCGEEISKKRLQILPFAIYCTDCQERREQIEEIQKREGLIG